MASAPTAELTVNYLNATSVVSTAVVSESSFVTLSPASLAKKEEQNKLQHLYH